MGLVNISEIVRKARERAAAENAGLYGDRLPVTSPKRKPRHIESEIQQSCVRWFRLAYPQYIILSIPNGGSRNVIEASNLKKEGALAGASDLMVVAERRVLFVEMKRPKGRQQRTQKEFQHRVEMLGHTYVICYSLDDFMQKVRFWLGKKNNV